MGAVHGGEDWQHERLTALHAAAKNRLPTTVDPAAMNVQVQDPRVFETMCRLTSALSPEGLVLVGGWAVHARLAQRGRSARLTQDVDALVAVGARPAMRKLVGVGGKQDDPHDHARLTGLPVDVDIMASHPDSGLRPIPNNHDIPRVIQAPDSLCLATPYMARLLATRHTPVDFTHDGVTIQIPVSGPGALLTCKLVTLGSEDRPQEKAIPGRKRRPSTAPRGAEEGPARRLGHHDPARSGYIRERR